MYLTRSFWRKFVVTLGAAVGFVFVYEATIPDSRRAFEDLVSTWMPPKPGARLLFTATAYCKGQTTASGVSVRTGIAAADPSLLPVGTVVELDAGDEKYSGVWTVMDTGPAVQGRTLDLYIWSCHEALAFGRRPVQISVLRLGWNPQNSAPGRVGALFRQRERDRDLAQLPLAAAPANPSLAPLAAPVATTKPQPVP